MNFYKLVFVVIIFTSCSSLYEIYPSTIGYEKVLNSWKGSDINRTMQAWGPPSNEYKMPNGNVMYTWLYVGNSYVYSNYNYYLNQIQSRAVTQHCKTTLTTSSSGIITGWRYDGNICKATFSK